MTDKSLPSSSPTSPTSTVPNTSNEGTKVDVVVPAGSTVQTTTTVTPTPATPPVSTASSSASSPSNSKKKSMSPQMLFAALGLLVLVIGAGVGFYLLGKSQEIRQQASGGYADCAGGVHDGQKACSGFREVVECHNGAFTPLRTCASDEKCDAGSATGCVKTARDCAGGVKDGQTACSGLHTQVTCKDGSFVDPVDCQAGVVCQSGRCGGGGTTGTPTPRPSVTPQPSPGGACQPLTSACDDVNNKCCAGGVCQGVGSNRRCEAAQDTCNDPNSNNDGVCGGNQGWLGFRCSNLTNGQCLENSQTFSNYNDAYAYASANGCGQVDEVCVGGWKNRNLCGSFQVISTSCGGGGGSPQPTPSPQSSPRVSPTPGVTPSPVASPSPAPTPSPAPVCLNIAISKPNVTVGDNVTFTCGTVAGVSSYQFRVKSPDGTITEVQPQTASGNVSQSFSITQQGSYKAQCRICVGSDRCQEWETF